MIGPLLESLNVRPASVLKVYSLSNDQVLLAHYEISFMIIVPAEYASSQIKVYTYSNNNLRTMQYIDD